MGYWLTGMFLFGHFSLSHTFMPVVEDGQHKDWIRFAMEHTVDISPGRWYGPPCGSALHAILGRVFLSLNPWHVMWGVG